ncbi:MAG: hypothetical protein AAF624_12870 [Bacteroidota bacterium]
MAPFDLIDPDPPGAFGRAPKRNAYVELHNMIAAAHSVREFGPDDTIRIGREHDVDFLGSASDGGAFATERGALYADFLRHRIADGDLTPAERADAAHLARTLLLERAALKRIHARVFGHTVAQVIADDCLDADEQLLLFTLQHTLGLDPDDAEASYERAARERLLQRIAHALCDGELDPDEADEIRAMEADLGVTVPERVAVMLAKASERHRLLHGNLRLLAIKPPVALREGEGVFWTGTGYGTGVPKPLGRHAHRVPFRQRSSLATFITRLQRQPASHAGRLLLTNERLFLSRHPDADSKDVRTVALRKVVDVAHTGELVLLVRDGKIDWLLRVDDSASVLAAMVQRMIANRDVQHRAKIERDRAVRLAEEERWVQRGNHIHSETKRRLREQEAYAEQVRARIAEREKQAQHPTPVSPDDLPRYRGPLLFQPDPNEVVLFSAPARWQADAAVQRAVEADPNVPSNSVKFHRALTDRQQQARGQGTLYLTNKRLLLIDPRADTVLFPLQTITKATLRTDEVEIDRSRLLGRVIALGEEASPFVDLLEHLAGWRLGSM